MASRSFKILLGILYTLYIRFFVVVHSEACKMQKGSTNEALKPLLWIIGKWKSVEANGSYPTLQPFSYCEEIEFISYGQPLLNYNSLAWDAEKKFPMHMESGYLRINPGTNEVSFIVAHNFGMSSLEKGNVTDDKCLYLKSTGLQRLAFTKASVVTDIRREYKLVNNKLHLLLSMATEKTPLSKHLEVTYEKLDSDT